MRLFSLVAVGTVASVGATYDYTIDCNSFSKPKNTTANSCDAEGDWTAILDRQLPEYYADTKLGIFIHWGLYSVPSWGNEWYWHNLECGGPNNPQQVFQDANYGPNWTYPDFARLFTATLYDADEWVRIFESSGAQYVLPVAKHHDGFCMWNCSATAPGWNVVDTGPRRDVLTELYDAVVASPSLDFGIYFSQGEWFDSRMVADSRANWTTTTYTGKMQAQRLDLVQRFPESVLWHTDGGWMAPDTYLGNHKWLNYVYDESPLRDHVVTCNSMGYGCCQRFPGCKNCFEYGDAPSGGDRTTAGEVIPHYYTNQMTLQAGSWSWDRKENQLANFLTADQLVTELVQTTAWNGTLIMNVGPRADGLIPPIFQERLAAVGAWLGVNGEAIYSTRPWLGSLPLGSEGNGTVYYTASKDTAQATVFATLLKGAYPFAGGDVVLTLPVATENTKAALLGSTEAVPCRAGPGGSGLTVTLPARPEATGANLWTLKLTGLAPRAV